MDLDELPEGTVIDGELAALDAAGRPRLGLLQNHRTSSAPIVYFPFDILFHRDRDLTALPLSERRKILREACPASDDVILSEVHTGAEEMLSFVLANGLEGVIAKRNDSLL
jgi:bifunctional non-homologous end joining protein LigD